MKITDLNIILPVKSAQVELFQQTQTSSSSQNNELLQTESPLNYIHIRIYQRKSRKYITTIEDLMTLPVENKDGSTRLTIDHLTKMTKIMKKMFSCSGVVKEASKQDSENKIISLSGDQRENIKKFLISNKIVNEKQIKIHGF